MKRKATTQRETRGLLCFDEKDSLHTKFLAIKQAVKGQHDVQSAEYATVRGIKW